MLAAVFPVALAGCAVGGNAIDDAVKTNAISLAAPAPTIAPDPFVPGRSGDGGDVDRLLDEDTMRLAVTTADLDRAEGNALAWANAATGASGEITSVVETRDSGQTCRSFTATRHAYDGASRYDGEVCLDPSSGWWTKALVQKGGSPNAN